MPNRAMNDKMQKENVRKAKFAQDQIFVEGLGNNLSKEKVRAIILLATDGVVVQKLKTGDRAVKSARRSGQAKVKFHPPIRSAGRV